MPKSNALCPGKEQFRDAKDLPTPVFEDLVRRRGRQLIGSKAKAAEVDRKEIEDDIRKHFEKIDQEENFLPASFLSRGAARSRAVCRVSTPQGRGTGFLIARGVVMTNHHVLPSDDVANESLAEFAFEEGKTPKRVALLPDHLFINDRELDFAIVACDPVGLEDIEPIGLSRSPVLVTRNDQVNIIQHPQGRPKEIAIHDNEVTRILDTVLRYRTDTEPGSSGSPVFNNAWELVGLHHAGFFEPDGRAMNEGIRISSIVGYLLRMLGQRGNSHEMATRALDAVQGRSPYLGFFDIEGVQGPDWLEVEVPHFRGNQAFADVGVWNIEHFNSSVPDQRVSDVAEVVANLGLNVLGLTEVQTDPLKRLTGKMTEFGMNMEFALKNVAGSQDIAVLFDADTTKVTLREDIAERHQQALDARTDAGKTVFPRHPLFAECEVEEQGRSIRFLLIVVHLKAFGDAQSRLRRRLASAALATIIEDVRETEDLPVVLGGDFNERLDTDVLTALSGSPDLFAMTTDDAAGDAISYVGNSHRSLIDHIIVSRDVALGDIAGDDAAIVRLDRSIADFSARVSDHVPVVFRMVYREAAIDDLPNSTSDGFSIPIPQQARKVRVAFGGA